MVLNMKNCKICGNQIPEDRIYCSNKCKFSDRDYNKSRGEKKIRPDNTKKIKCKLCGFETYDVNNYGGHATKHLKEEHSLFESKYMQYYNLIQLADKPKHKCPYCDWSTYDIDNKSGCFTTHLKSKHDITPYDYIKSYPDQKYLWKLYFERRDRDDFIKLDSKNRIKCKICGEYLKKLSNTHLQKHNITPTEYKYKYDVRSTTSEYTSQLQSELTTAFNYSSGSAFPRKPSSLEDDFELKLENIGIQYIHPFLYMGKLFDFYLPDINLVIEIDGIAYHPNKLEELTIQTLHSVINDYSKNKMMDNSKFNFKRIRYNDIQFNDVEELKSLVDSKSYAPDYTIEYDQKISTKEYFEKYIKYRSKDKLNFYIPLFLKFIRTLHPDFPYPPQTENITDVVSKIQKFDYSKIYTNNTFNNNTSNLGVSYLKSNFKSYWNSSFKEKQSPIQLWNDDYTLSKIIANRIGLNNFNESFDFSMHTLIRGMSANRYSISFFKPVLAAAVYQHILTDKQNPVVIDPCAGFGGRMLGFKSMYPNGKYIGIEPNVDTFSELRELSKNFSNIQLHNCKLEDYTGSRDCDLTFTSIPYYDTETYSQTIKYNLLEDWKNTFLKSLHNFKNTHIVVSKKLYDDLKLENDVLYSIQNNAGHFSEDRTKLEYIISFCHSFTGGGDEHTPTRKEAMKNWCEKIGSRKEGNLYFASVDRITAYS